MKRFFPLSVTAVLEDYKPLFIPSRQALFLFIPVPAELRAKAGLNGRTPQPPQEQAVQRDYNEAGQRSRCF